MDERTAELMADEDARASMHPHEFSRAFLATHLADERRKASLLGEILALLRRPVDPSLVRIRAVDATDAEKIAISSGFERSLPPELISG